VVSSSRYHDALKVAEDDNERHLRIWSDDDDDPAVDLFLGSSPNYRISHVRLGDDDRVYEVRGLGKYDLRADAKSWIENRLVDIASSDVASVRLKNGHGAFTLTHNDKGWAASSDRSAPAGDLDSSKVETFIRSVSGLRVSEPAGPLDEQAQGLEHPAAELVVTSASSGESVAKASAMWRKRALASAR
jgi:hypothetical protein